MNIWHVIAYTVCVLLIAGGAYSFGVQRGFKILEIEYIPGMSPTRPIKTFEYQDKTWGCYEIQ